MKLVVTNLICAKYSVIIQVRVKRKQTAPSATANQKQASSIFVYPIFLLVPAWIRFSIS